MRLLEHWTHGGRTFDKVRTQATPTGTGHLGGGVEVPTGAPALIIHAGRVRSYWGFSHTGLFSLYYAISNGTVTVGTSKFEVAQKAKTTAKQCEAGVVYVFSGSDLKRYSYPKASWLTTPTDHPETMAECADELESFLIEAAEDLATVYGTKKAAVLLSGGTDSTMTVLALKAAGYEVKAFSVGTSREVYDPSHAERYASILGVEYEFVQIPSHDFELQKMLEEALLMAELRDFSNVLMACCTALALRVIKQQGFTLVFHGYFADMLVGNDTYIYPDFNREFPVGSPTRTDAAWSTHRIKKCTHITNNTLWLDALSTCNGMQWATLFNHPLIQGFLFWLPMRLLPVGQPKHLYWQLLDQYIDNGAWHDTRKIGFYTGSGIGTVRLKNPVLQDANIRETSTRIFKEVK